MGVLDLDSIGTESATMGADCEPDATRGMRRPGRTRPARGTTRKTLLLPATPPLGRKLLASARSNIPIGTLSPGTIPSAATSRRRGGGMRPPVRASASAHPILVATARGREEHRLRPVSPIAPCGTSSRGTHGSWTCGCPRWHRVQQHAPSRRPTRRSPCSAVASRHRTRELQ